MVYTQVPTSASGRLALFSISSLFWKKFSYDSPWQQRGRAAHCGTSEDQIETLPPSSSLCAVALSALKGTEEDSKARHKEGYEMVFHVSSEK